MLQKSSLIHTDNLSKSYGSNDAVLRGINLDIYEGEKVALIGANGAGKSTLLKSLVGLHSVSDGSIRALGETFSNSPNSIQRKTICRQIGFVFQRHGLVKRLSALSNVLHGKLGLKNGWRALYQTVAPSIWREEAFRALQAVKLSDKTSMRADQLSGGQLQRVAIARALIRKPRLFIADEPAASLDPAAGHQVMEQFVQLADDRGITLVFTSHDMDHAIRYADRIIALKGGEIFIDEKSSSLSKTDLTQIFHA